jgi:hypothetical protein
MAMPAADGATAAAAASGSGTPTEEAFPGRGRLKETDDPPS